VRAGDTLWDLAARSLPADADPAAIAGACTRLWRANRAVVGDDPDLIRPGTILRLPPRKDA
jgi:nucleoid-associated protein YgaU